MPIIRRIGPEPVKFIESQPISSVGSLPTISIGNTLNALASVTLVSIPTVSTQPLPYSYYKQESLVSGYTWHGFTAPGNAANSATFKILRETLLTGEVLFANGAATFIHTWSATSLASISYS